MNKKIYHSQYCQSIGYCQDCQTEMKRGDAQYFVMYLKDGDPYIGIVGACCVSGYSSPKKPWFNNGRAA